MHPTAVQPIRPPGGRRRVVGYHGTIMGLRIALFAGAVLVSGCSAAAPGESGRSLTPASVGPSPIDETSPGASPGTIELSAVELDPVVADIARVAGVPVEAVTVISAESVTFPDGSLGCPVPGLAYTQVVVDGYRIVAEAGGKTYDYRGSGPGNFRACTTGG
jgi:hypothetical protein